ncbi:MAG TPA: peptidylprolyl isomerase [Thermodesulfovibrionales bacterium]|nr:peptidylprolyl isomerase [Thermodesulfovibrionales bacterium]
MKAFVRRLSIGFSLFLFIGMSALAYGQNPSGEGEGRQSDTTGGYILVKTPITSPQEESGGSVLQRVPINSSRFSDVALASVNDDPITFREFRKSLAEIHGEMSEKTDKAGRIDFAQVLRRLINTRLAVAEAKEIGIDEQPEIREEVKAFAKQALRSLMLDQLTKDVVPDEAEVEKLYQDRLEEFKLKEVWFLKKEDAEKMEEAVKAGKDFDNEAKQMIAHHTADTYKEESLKKGDMGPEIRDAISGMAVGSVSPIIPTQKVFLILKLEDVQSSKDPAAVREEARAEALSKKRTKVIEENTKALSEKYLKLDQELFDSLDFEAEKPGFLSLMEDKRVLVEVKGGEPITVGEYTNDIKDTYFHDVEGAIKRKRVNRKKKDMLYSILSKRAILMEALARGIDKTDEYKALVRDYEDSVVFSAFVSKVVVPDVKVSRAEVEAYYHEHQSEFSTREQIKFDSIIFDKRDEAEKAIEELRKGTDPKWIKENAEGQVDKKTAGGSDEEVGGELLNMSDLPEGLHKAVLGVKPGDVRLYMSSRGYFYVLMIREVYPPRPLPLQAVGNTISDRLFSEKLNKHFDELMGKLWGSYSVKIFADDLAKQIKEYKP